MGLDEILQHAQALAVHIPEVPHRLGLALLGRLAVPSDGFNGIRGGAAGSTEAILTRAISHY